MQHVMSPAPFRWLGRASSKEDMEDDLSDEAMGARHIEDQMRISFDDLAFIRRVGHGGFSTTYLAELNVDRNETRKLASPECKQLVAVKVASWEADSLGQWRSEVYALTKLEHRNIVRYFGFVATPPMHCLVLEYCDGGDLCERLKHPIPPGFVLKVAGGIASALAYLHERRLMHRDIKSANVLLESDGITPKLTDFGVATVLPDQTIAPHGHNSRHLTAETGTYRWMAPEVITHQPYSASADIYSFSMVLYELITHHAPFNDRSALQAAAAAGLENKRPPLPASTPKPLSELLDRTWAAERLDRPPATQLVIVFEEMKHSLPPDEIAWLDAPDGHPCDAPTLPLPQPKRKLEAPANDSANAPETASQGILGAGALAQCLEHVPARFSEALSRCFMKAV